MPACQERRLRLQLPVVNETLRKGSPDNRSLAVLVTRPYDQRGLVSNGGVDAAGEETHAHVCRDSGRERSRRRPSVRAEHRLEVNRHGLRFHFKGSLCSNRKAFSC
ncbi:hypothetical protein GN956_G20362 [Arapaima gigas]